jgi:hypothetical protein
MKWPFFIGGDSVKGQAKRCRLPILFAKKGTADLKQALKNEKGETRRSH